MTFLQVLQRTFAQSFFLPAPALTEKNLSDQTGRVHLITGGYAGVGEQLASLLYGANATVFVAGRSASKAERAMRDIKAAHPQSRGALEFLQLDLQDLTTIAPAADDFTRRAHGKLHVLTNNAGVMMPPEGSRSAQGHELQIATNCLGGFLLTRLLLPTLKATAAAEGAQGAVRVTWAASIAVELLCPKGGIAFADGNASSPPGQHIPPPKVLGKNPDYGQSKTGNYFLAAELARRDGWGREEGIAYYSWNPGNLTTELQRHMSWLEATLLKLGLHPARFGAYTELFAACAPELAGLARSGCFIAPWGRVFPVRDDVEREVARARAGEGAAERFFRWCVQETDPYTAASAKL